MFKTRPHRALGWPGLLIQSKTGLQPTETPASAAECREYKLVKGRRETRRSLPFQLGLSWHVQRAWEEGKTSLVKGTGAEPASKIQEPSGTERAGARERVKPKTRRLAPHENILKPDWWRGKTPDGVVLPLAACPRVG